ncbi:hypothetical protein M2444_006792 [Paenibacillus sp. PastF-3]|nr:hypothetical protein [Paenibacillus sp. PastF-3]
MRTQNNICYKVNFLTLGSQTEEALCLVLGTFRKGVSTSIDRL